MENNCIFCRIIQHEIPASIVKENEHILVIRDIHPKAPTHFLIIPKKHVDNMACIGKEDEFIALEMFKMVKEFAKDLGENPAFNLISNNGAKAGQSVFHMHWHFLSGKDIFQGRF